MKPEEKERLEKHENKLFVNAVKRLVEMKFQPNIGLIREEMGRTDNEWHHSSLLIDCLEVFNRLRAKGVVKAVWDQKLRQNTISLTGVEL